MAKNLVIVESPAKAKTIKKFLGSTYKIEASVGHVRDLPKSEMGVKIENDFEPKYITIRGKGEVLSKLRKAAKAADKIYLATDPDREGEAISWHLAAALKLEEKDVNRITFNEITKTAVKKSIKEARGIDMDLVNAQQARRVLDRIVGYGISPVLWKKVRRRLSAGRVQSVALRIICDREEEVSDFVPKEYWSIDTKLVAGNKAKLKAYYYGKENEKTEIENKAQADKIVASIKRSKLTVEEVKRGTRTRKPYPPFTTSSLQQEASKQLGFGTLKTMRIAQQLYEGVDVEGEGTIGLVSYIRTDSVRISDEAYGEASAFVVDEYGKEYLNSERPVHKAKGKTQDAHEAIRPTYVHLTPKKIAASLTGDQAKLYGLIWERMVASIMSPAEYETLQIKIKAGTNGLRAGGQTLAFDGFLKVYKPKDDEGEKSDKLSSSLKIEAGDRLQLDAIEAEQHFTQPPARYTEATLVKTLEELGVGRPSTYAPTIATILARFYVIKEGKNLYPTELGEIVNEIMKNYFKDIVDVGFTASMEAQLDLVEEGEEDWKKIIREFYGPFKENLDIAEEQIGDIEIEDEKSDVLCEKCGANMVIKYGKFGKFLACPNFPDCRNAKPFFEETGIDCPLCGGKILVKKTKKGRVYYGCEHNPDCGFMSWDRPTDEKCPDCGEMLFIKNPRKPSLVCNKEGCGYRRVVQKEEA